MPVFRSRQIQTIREGVRRSATQLQHTFNVCCGSLYLWSGMALCCGRNSAGVLPEVLPAGRTFWRTAVSPSPSFHSVIFSARLRHFCTVQGCSCILNVLEEHGTLQTLRYTHLPSRAMAIVRPGQTQTIVRRSVSSTCSIYPPIRASHGDSDAYSRRVHPSAGESAGTTHLPSRGGDREVLASPLQPVKVCKPVLHSSTHFGYTMQ